MALFLLFGFCFFGCLGCFDRPLETAWGMVGKVVWFFRFPNAQLHWELVLRGTVESSDVALHPWLDTSTTLVTIRQKKYEKNYSKSKNGSVGKMEYLSSTILISQVWQKTVSFQNRNLQGQIQERA